MGYRGHQLNGKAYGKIHLAGKIPKSFTKTARKWMKRRAAVESIISHIKSDHRMNRNYLKGKIGNQNNAILAAYAYNFKKLLKWFYCVLDKIVKNSGKLPNYKMFVRNPIGCFRDN